MKKILLSAKQIGHFDNKSRFYVHEQYATQSSKQIRSPSAAHPFSVYKHVFTKKYATQLAEKLGVESVEIAA